MSNRCISVKEEPRSSSVNLIADNLLFKKSEKKTNRERAYVAEQWALGCFVGTYDCWVLTLVGSQCMSVVAVSEKLSIFL